MNLKETLEQIKAEFSAIADKVKPKKFGSATTTDGVVVQYEGDQLVQGVAVTLEDGTPAPDGEHTLEDGTVIVVSEGLVAEIKAAEAPEPQSDFAAQFTAIETRISKYEAALEANTKSIAEIQANISKMLEIANKQMDAFAAFAEQTPEPKKKEISATKIQKDNSLAAFAKSLNSIK